MRFRPESGVDGEPLERALPAGPLPAPAEPGRADIVDEQRRAAALVREAAGSVRAPAHLRAWLAAQSRDQAVPPSTRRTTRRRPR